LENKKKSYINSAPVFSC